MIRSRAAAAAPVALALLAAGLAAAPAAAAIKVATYTGIIFTDGGFLDTAGPTFVNIGNYSFTATFTYDTSLGERGLDPVFLTETTFGGPDAARPLTASPMLDFTFVVEGLPGGSFAFTSARSGFITADWGPPFPTAGHSAWFDAENYLAVGGSIGTPQVGIDANVDTTALAPISRSAFRLTNGTRSVAGELIANGTYTVTDRDSPPPPPPGAIPEPATWALLILGFGLIGTAARRRRRVPVSA